MIWPGRPLAIAAMVPALLSLGLFASVSLQPAILAVDALVVVVALIDLATLLGSRRFRVVRRTSAVCSLGEPFPVELLIENLGRSGRSLQIRDDLPESMEPDLARFDAKIPRQGEAFLTYKVTPRRRGSYEFQQVYALISSRLGFWRRSIAWPCLSKVEVYPDIHQIARYTLLARRDKLSAIGVRRSRRMGTDNEFERLRDYADGDEPRHLDWKATARRRKLTVRAHQVNQSQRILFLIDCGRMMAGDTGGGLSPLDHAFNAMLILRGDQVGLLAYSDRIRAYVPPGGGATRINRMVHAVHNIFPELVEPRHDRAFVELERRCRKRSLVVLMTNVFDEVNARQIGDHLGNIVGRHLPLGVFLRDQDLFALADQSPDEGPGLYAGAVAASMLTWRERIMARLRLKGALTLDVFPAEITAPLINQYLQIKARHLL
jgi:uncharacterized protein (DUF58 family)